MKGLIILIIIGFLTSVLSKKKVGNVQKNISEVLGDSIEDNNIKDDTNINMKETQYNENVYRQNQTSGFTKKEVLTDVKNKKAFDLKRAVVYSSILERPYK